MTKKKRTPATEPEATIESTSEVAVAEPKAKVVQVKPKITFELWFAKATAEARIKVHQKPALLVYFRKQGLSKIENKDAYDKAFETF